MKWLKNLFSVSKTEEAQKTGKIKFFNRQKGYGFIQSESTTKDVFVHATNLKDFVKRGDQVSFELKYSSKGLEAKQVKLIK